MFLGWILSRDWRFEVQIFIEDSLFVIVIIFLQFLFA